MSAVRYEVICDFQAEDIEVEMSVKTGEHLLIEADSEQTQGWILAKRVSNGEEGYVPLDFVKKSGPENNPPPPPQPQIQEQQQENLPPQQSSFSHFGDIKPMNIQGNNSTSKPTNEDDFLSIRRSSDPRLTSHLLGIMDPLALEAIKMEQAALNMTQKPSSGSKLNKTISDLGSLRGLVELKKEHKAPALSAAALAEDYEEIYRRNDEFHKKMVTHQADAFGNLQAALSDLNLKIAGSTKTNSALLSKIQSLDECIDEERRKWKQQNDRDAQKNSVANSKVDIVLKARVELPNTP